MQIGKDLENVYHSSGLIHCKKIGGNRKKSC